MQGFLLGVLPLLVLVTGCLRHGAVTVSHGKDVDKGLARARASSVSFYFAGSRFAGLPLTDVEVDKQGRAFFAYGTCVIPAGQEGGCAVPVQIQNFPFERSSWRLAVGCRRRPDSCTSRPCATTVSSSSPDAPS